MSCQCFTKITLHYGLQKSALMQSPEYVFPELGQKFKNHCLTFALLLNDYVIKLRGHARIYFHLWILKKTIKRSSFRSFSFMSPSDLAQNYSPGINPSRSLHRLSVRTSVLSRAVCQHTSPPISLVLYF